MTKALDGTPLGLDDGPAHDRDLFLIDGNNLAYRAFYALPEALATSTGQPTNALLGFANMLFRLLVDYRPKSLVVAWDRRPVTRILAAPTYKAERKAMPDKLSQQFPFFQPIVDALGYRNVFVEGWEADDVIATLATRAEALGMRTCIVSTDRDAFQLVSDRTCVMMTPRGVADVEVYTPERIVQRYGITPAQITDFVGLKGDSSDNIPGVPGIGEKSAAQLILQFGTLERILEQAASEKPSAAIPPARRRSLVENAEQARAAKALATTRRDLDLDCDLQAIVATPADRSRMREMFERFEFKNLSKRADLLDPPSR